MQDGIKLLIDRMDQYPEEFFGDLSFRWSEIMQDIAKHGPEFLDEEDILMLNKKVKEIRRKELNAKIVEEIASGTRLRVAQERQAKANTYTTQGSPSLKAAYDRSQSLASLGATTASIARAEGNQVWWSGAVPGTTSADYQRTEKYRVLMNEGIHDLIERGKDKATIQNIRAQNAILEEKLQAVKYDIAQRDAEMARSQAYKKRNNQNWK
jgi:hypothetical protein